jgi:hypothetical protein
LSVESLEFDPLNPRWPRYLLKGDDAEVIDWMLKEANIVELMGSIGEQGYFEGEPLIVVPSKTKPGHHDVVEGNRRLTAVKLLSQPDLATTRKKSVSEAAEAAQFKPKVLPVLEFKNRGEVLRYLAYRHITGIEPWNPLQKGRYLKQLAGSPGFSELPKDELRKRLAKEIGSNANYVARLLAGLAVYERIEDAHFFDIPDLDEKTISYSVLTTALNYDNLAKHIGLKSPTDDDLADLDKDGLKELTRWLYEKNAEQQTRLGESRNLQKLARVVATPRALKKFRDGTPLAEADLLTSGPIESFRTSLGQAKSRLETARDSVHLIEAFSADDAEILKEIQKLARLLATHVDDSLMDSSKKS